MNKIFVYILCAFAITIPFLLSRKCNIKLNWNSKVKPPNIVFGIVWPILYILMTISLYYILTSNKKNYIYWIALISTTLGFILNYLYVIKTGCNNDWTTALYILVAYVMILIVQLLSCYMINPIAGILIAPLLGWTIFALILNSLYLDRLN
jgi:benzodiazapine receptor